MFYNISFYSAYFYFINFYFFNITIDDVFVSNVISSISIFSGLLFSVIFILLENYNKRKDKIGNNPPEELVRYVKRYKDFTSKISTIILFSSSDTLLIVKYLLLTSLHFKPSNLNSLKLVIIIPPLFL